MSIFKRTFLLNDDEKQQVAEMSGKIILWILEGRSIGYMSDQLNLNPQEIEANIGETLYILRKYVGRNCYFKTLFVK